MPSSNIGITLVAIAQHHCLLTYKYLFGGIGWYQYDNPISKTV